MTVKVGSPKVVKVGKTLTPMLSFNVYAGEGELGFILLGWKIRDCGKLATPLMKYGKNSFYSLANGSRAVCVEIYKEAKIHFFDAFPQFFPLDMTVENAVKSAVYSNAGIAKALPEMVQK